MPQESPRLEPVPVGAPLIPEPSARRPGLIGVGLDAQLGLPFAQLLQAAQYAGQLGFESLWTPAGYLAGRMVREPSAACPRAARRAPATCARP